jgi:hypothetical protein
MATLGTTFPTLLDQAKRMDPNGSIANIVELLSQRNALIQDAVAIEGNLPTGHRFTSRTGLPAVSWRRFNQGVTPSKSRTSQFTESCGMLVARSVVDCALARLNGNEAAFRASEDRPFLAALANEAESSIIYGNNTTTTPEEILGLTPRYNDLDTGDAAGNIVTYDTTNDATNTSIWFIVWGEDGAHLIYPKGSTAGIVTKDMGEQLIADGASNAGATFRAYVTEYEWSMGVCVRDWRNVVRLANVDSAQAATSELLIPKMIESYYKLNNPMAGKLGIYMNRQTAAILHKEARLAAKNGTLGLSTYEGKEIVTFMGHPIRISDAILNTEDDVTT